VPYRPTIWVCAVATILATVALVFFIASVQIISKASNARAWPAVDARITAAQVVRGCNRGADFSPKFRYEYSIGTERYSAERLSLTAFGMCGSEAEVTLFAQRYPVGSVIRIHVNPDAPNDAVIDVNPGMGADAMLALVSLSIFIGFSLMAWSQIRAAVRARSVKSL
jgi:hypothetical protein